MKSIRITVFGCEQDEAAAFRKVSPEFGALPVIVQSPVSSCADIAAYGNRCVSVDHKSRVTGASLSALQRAGVAYVSTRSVGVDHIDMEAAAKMGIAVGNVAYEPDGVADYTLMLILMAVRNAKSIVTGAERFDYRPDNVRGKELRDMTVGIIGTGRIGRAVIRRLLGFGCRVLAHDRSQDAEKTPLRELLEQSDIVSLHTPLTPETRCMIGRSELDRMKRGAFLVNTARGALVDTRELIAALKSGKLGGAALDVVEGEEGLFYFDCSKKPMENTFLLELHQMPNVIITPHTAYYTGRVLYDTARKTIQNCLNFERGHGND